jgi:hypothetical protein
MTQGNDGAKASKRVKATRVAFGHRDAFQLSTPALGQENMAKTSCPGPRFKPKRRI